MSDNSNRHGVAYWTATVAGLGRVPLMPGTAGSAAGIVLWIGTSMMPATLYFQAGLCLVLLAAGIWSGSVVEKNDQVKDPSYVVIDETLGMLITLMGISLSWLGGIAGFILFRIFDIWKPFPIGPLQRIKGGTGIMIDDIAAGIAGAIFVRVLLRLVTHLI